MYRVNIISESRLEYLRSNRPKKPPMIIPSRSICECGRCGYQPYFRNKTKPPGPE